MSRNKLPNRDSPPGWLQKQSAGHFFSTRKIERTGRKTCRTRNEVKVDVFDYIERFHNPKRQHSMIDCISPGNPSHGCNQPEVAPMRPATAHNPAASQEAGCGRRPARIRSMAQPPGRKPVLIQRLS